MSQNWKETFNLNLNKMGFEFAWPFDPTLDGIGEYVLEEGFKTTRRVPSVLFDHTWRQVGETPSGWGLYDGPTAMLPDTVPVARRSRNQEWVANGHQGSPRQSAAPMYTFSTPVDIAEVTASFTANIGNSARAYITVYASSKWTIVARASAHYSKYTGSFHLAAKNLRNVTKIAFLSWGGHSPKVTRTKLTAWGNSALYISRTSDHEFTLTGAQLTYRGTGSVSATVGLEGTGGQTDFKHVATATMDGQSHVLRWNLAGSVKTIGLHFTGNYENSGYLERLVIEGTGANPFEPTGEGNPDPPILCETNDRSSSVDPISLYRGEKRERVTDLTLNTATGSLDLTRTYRQSTHTLYQQMGLGWTHNHALSIDTSVNNMLIVNLRTGGRAYFTRLGSTDIYKATVGGYSEIDASGRGTSKYTLTAADDSTFVFDDQQRLRTHTWSNGEVWTYRYYQAPHYAEGLLQEVSDGSGRKLQFTYIDNEGQFDDRQLWRVGDQTAAGLETSTPSGRYVEFAYTSEKSGGNTISGAKALLETVRDVRGETWTYDYYGQDSHETASDLLNFLMSVTSPAVDTTGDGPTDGSIIIKNLSYTVVNGEVTAITQRLGKQGATPYLKTIDYTFQPNGENETIETIAGQATTHRFTSGIHSEIEDPSGNIQVNGISENYRTAAQKDANGNYTQLEWSADGRTLAGVTDAGGNPTRFAYNANHTLQSSTDAQGRKTDYTYGDSANPRQPTIIKVLDGTSVLRQQTFSYDSKGRTTEERLIDPDDGTTVLQKTTRVYATSGTGHGLLESVTQVDLTNAANNISTTYTYDSAGRVIKTQKSSLLGSCQFTYSVYDDAGNVLATVCGRESATIPTTVAAARALYDATDPAKFTVTTHAYDALGRRTQTTTQAGSPSEQTTWTVYDALDRVTRTIDNYVASASVPNPATAAHSAFDHGSDANQNRVTDTAYNARGLVRSQTDVLGHVTLIGYDAAGRLVKTIQSASQPSYNNDYTGTAADPDLSAYPASSNPDQDAITQQVYDANGNQVQTIDPSGQSHFTVYDALNRPVKTIRSAKAAASSTLNPGATAANDPRSDDYAPSTDPDRDLIEATEYDALGRVIRTRRLLENRPSAIWETTLYGYDTLGRQVKVIRSASQADYDLAADPDLSAYTAADAADQDLISTTTYDNQGRVSYPTDVNGAQTRYVYDGLNRQVKTVNNYVVQGTSDPAAWVWDASDSRWERASTGNVAVEHGPANDQNHISQTVYDSDGRVQSTRDVSGRMTYTVYDASSRPIRRIANYVPSGTTDPAAWVWSTANSRWEDGTGTAIPRGTNADQNTITETVYNNEGQVQQTIDGRRNVSYNLYDETGRQVMRIANYVPSGTSNPANWAWSTANNRWESSAGQAVDHGPANDQNTISHTTYDLAGRVRATRAAAGIETRYTYDKLGRRIKTVHNYVDGVFDAAHPDQDLISQTTYNKVGQVIQTSDARGTKTTFSYDAAGRRLTVTQAAGTYLETTNYTCYDKAGRVLRTIQNWQATRISPDARTATGAWQFNPRGHGSRNDRNLITAFAYDAAGRRTRVTDPAGNATTTTYDKDGSVNSTTDAEGTVSAYRYDGLRRRNRVIQNYVANGEDPSLWVWDTTQSRYETSTGTAIAHNTDNDQNVIVQVTHDLADRMTDLRDPRGNLTRYEYDGRNRRTKRTNPLAHEWRTAYADLSNGGTRTTQTYPGLGSGGSYDVTREFDQLGRLSRINYNSATTPNVAFNYDIAGNRTQMTERTGTTDNRITHFGYDDQRRLTSVGFDSNGDGTVDETVRYSYDAGGLRTQMTLPGSKTIAYSYDEVGRLIGLRDWGNQHSDFHYDKAGRHVGTQRPNGLLSDYAYNPAGHLRRVRHRAGSSLRGQFNYEVDKRGNRTRAFERLAQSTTVSATYNKSASQVTFTRGTWTDVGDFKQTAQFSGRMQIAYTGDEALLTIGTGPDHGMIDISINDNYWRRFNTYTAQPGERVLHIPAVPTPPGETSGKLSIKVRSDNHFRSTGHVFRFKQLQVIDATYNERTIDYTYDGLSRLQQANYNTGERVYNYAYDLAGNLTNMNGATRTYNAANQLTNDGTHTLTYDPNGNLTNDGTNTYTWDRANRMLTAPNNTSYIYDGLGNRVSQTVSNTVTNYLLDLQPGLTKVLAATTGTNTNHYIHSVRGLHAMQNNAGNWSYMAQDGLGSVRSEIDSTLGVDTTHNYDPYGNYIGTPPTTAYFGFTGEQTDANDLLFLRARYYNPSLGVFPSLDPFEGLSSRPMSLNGYSWVEGNIPNVADPTGLIGETPGMWDRCMGSPLPTGQGQSGGCGAANSPQEIRGTWNIPHAPDYFLLVRDSKEWYLQAAELRLGELKGMLCPSSNSNGNGCFTFPGEEHIIFQNMTVEEYASRIAAAPVALNVLGWTQQIHTEFGDTITKCLRNPSHHECITSLTPHFTTIQSLLLGVGVVWDEQSAGFLEIRYKEFLDLINGNVVYRDDATPYQIAPIDIYSKWGNTENGIPRISETSCQDHPEWCFRDYIQTNYDGDSYTEQGTTSRNESHDLLAQLSAARYTNHMIQYLIYTSNPQNVDPSINSSKWAVRCSLGTASGSNVCVNNPANDPQRYPGGEGGFEVALRYFRGVFGSNRTDCPASGS